MSPSNILSTFQDFAAQSISVKNPFGSLIPLFVHGEHAVLVRAKSVKSIATVMNGFDCVAAAGESDEGLLKDVVFYALDSRQESILWDVKPAFVVVYDPDVTFVRQLEVQQSSFAQAENKQ